MVDPCATKADLDGIKKTNWIQTAIVPVVVAVIAVVGGWYTTRKQAALEAELVHIRSQVEVSNKVILEANSTRGRLMAEAEIAFFTSAKSVLSEVDTEFHAEAYFTRNNKKLSAALGKLRKLTEEAPDTITQSVIASLTKYQEFIVQGWLKFDSKGFGDTDRKNTYEESAKLLKTVRGEIYDSSRRATSGQ
jgi:hypothetical protein